MKVKEWIKQKKELCGKATPGEWISTSNGCISLEYKPPRVINKRRLLGTQIGTVQAPHKSIKPNLHNSDFIADARTSLPLALKVMKKYREALSHACICEFGDSRSCVCCEARDLSIEDIEKL